MQSAQATTSQNQNFVRKSSINVDLTPEFYNKVFSNPMGLIDVKTNEIVAKNVELCRKLSL